VLRPGTEKRVTEREVKQCEELEETKKQNTKVDYGRCPNQASPTIKHARNREAKKKKKAAEEFIGFQIAGLAKQKKKKVETE
jgi:hypothetical protein